MSALHIADLAIEIDDQNRRMTGIVTALVSGMLTAVLATLAWIF